MFNLLLQGSRVYIICSYFHKVIANDKIQSHLQAVWIKINVIIIKSVQNYSPGVFML